MPFAFSSPEDAQHAISTTYYFLALGVPSRPTLRGRSLGRDWGRGRGLKRGLFIRCRQLPCHVGTAEARSCSAALFFFLPLFSVLWYVYRLPV